MEMEIGEDSLMENRVDMLERLDRDTARNVLRYLDAPADIARLTAVSRSCRRIVVESRCSRDLCIIISPDVSRFNCVMEVDKMTSSEGASSSKGLEWENLKREHRVYTQLAHELMGSPSDKGCICDPISASSTDNYPEENIIYTLDPRHRENDRPLYWSSKGESNKEVPETLTYRLNTDLCVVHEVKIRPFQAYFQRGSPIYSANSVRFRFGHSSSSLGNETHTLDGFMSIDSYAANENYVWTYVSPEYPMKQEDKLQTFKLPSPVLCIGGILQIELLGRIQKQEMDGLYYICVCHVHAIGRSLSSFHIQVLGQPKHYILKYSEKQEHLDLLSEDTSRVTSEDDETASSSWHYFAESIRQMRAERVLTMLGNIAVADLIPPNDQESDEEDGDVNLFL